MREIVLKKKSFFSQIILLVILSLVCVVITVSAAFLVGSYQASIFDFSNLNLANMIPVLFIGGFVSCVVIGITLLFIARSIFLRVKDYFTETNHNGGSEK